MGIALLILLQTFKGVLTVTTLALVAVLAERRKAEEAQAELVGQLQQAFDEIKTIHGMIPICVWCKKIRDDGSWEQLENYLGNPNTARTIFRFRRG